MHIQYARGQCRGARRYDTATAMPSRSRSRDGSSPAATRVSGTVLDRAGERIQRAVDIARQVAAYAAQARARLPSEVAEVALLVTLGDSVTADRSSRGCGDWCRRLRRLGSRGAARAGAVTSEEEVRIARVGGRLRITALLGGVGLPPADERKIDAAVRVARRGRAWSRVFDAVPTREERRALLTCPVGRAALLAEGARRGAVAAAAAAARDDRRRHGGHREQQKPERAVAFDQQPRSTHGSSRRAGRARRSGINSRTRDQLWLRLRALPHSPTTNAWHP